MDKRIVFTTPDGSCGIEIPSGEITMETLTAKVQARKDITNIRQITTAELPVDRLFRSAWDDSNPENFIGTNLIKAQAIAHRMRRADRETKLSPLDKEFAFVSTSASRKTAINIERNKILTDNTTVQTGIDAANDEAELRTVLNDADIT